MTEYQHMTPKKDPCVALARQTIDLYVREGRVLRIPEDTPEELLSARAGAFVTLYKNGQLRGCIGTISPVRKTLADEIIHNAISSSTEDPRFSPVTADELSDLVISVDVLGDAEPIESIEELDPLRYGVIVTQRFRRGLLLPNLEGIDTPEEQVAIALRKAGIYGGEYKLERFEVVRHKD